MKSIKYQDQKPPIGEEVIAFSPDWVDEDYNPKGMRVGYQNEDDNGPFLSAKWNNYHDCYDTDDETKPTHWIHFPKFVTDDTYAGLTPLFFVARLIEHVALDDKLTNLAKTGGIVWSIESRPFTEEQDALDAMDMMLMTNDKLILTIQTVYMRNVPDLNHFRPFIN